MRIKTTKQMRLDELIKHIIENEITDTKFRTTDAPYWEVVEVNKTGVINVSNVSGNRRFNIQTEEKLTMETEIHNLTELYFDGTFPSTLETEFYGKESISSILDEDTVDTYSLAIYHKDILIWSKTYGIPTEGLIEI